AFRHLGRRRSAGSGRQVPHAGRTLGRPTVVRRPDPDPGSSGNHLFGVTMGGADDAWAVGQQLGPAGHDETLIEHWDGRHWTAVPSPSLGADSAFLDAVAIGRNGVWAVGKTIDAVAGDRPWWSSSATALGRPSGFPHPEARSTTFLVSR